MASASSSIVWILLLLENWWQTLYCGSINGAVAGLAGVTAASGFITVQSAIVLGVVIGVASFSAIKYIKDRKKVDDVLDVSSVHGVSGIVGTIAVGILATTIVNPNGPTSLLYGGNVMQIGIQVIESPISAIALSFVGTFIILKIIDKVMGLRVKEAEEDIGLDISGHAERAYFR